jgi:16S rRNA (guanine(966)-N(2))-methyltransferase RsmD
LPRIISGRAGGIPLIAPKGQDTRPTAAKTKEALFSILAPLMMDCTFLDLYAGTGQIGLEAASRGARAVVLVEQARAGLAAITANLEKTRLSDVTRVQPGTTFSAVRQLIASDQSFDLIFLDPPYRQAIADFEHLAPDLVRLLAPGGRIILEHDAKSKAPDFVMELKRTRSCQYGTAMLSFYQV